MTASSSHDVWDALANPHRRRLLDLLRGGPQTTGELAEALPDISRYAVMQHLGVLTEAGLVLHRYHGRHRTNYLNPVPLQRAYDRWLRGQLAVVGRAMSELAHHFELDEQEELTMDLSEHRVVRIEAEVEISAEPARVFEALTTGLDNWWKLRIRDESRVVCEPRVGGTIYESWGEGQGLVYGSFAAFDPPHSYTLVSHGGSGEATYFSKNLDRIEPRNGGAVFKKTLLMWGVVPEETETMFRQGTGRVCHQLKEHLELG